MKIRYNPILCIIILLSLCFGLWLVYARHKIEEPNTTVEMVMDYQALRRMAAWEGAEAGTVLKRFKQAGVTTLAVYDATLERYRDEGMLQVQTGKALLNAWQQGADGGDFVAALAAGQVNLNAVYILPGKADNAEIAYEEALEDLRFRYGNRRVRVLEGGLIEVLGNPNDDTRVDFNKTIPIMQAPLGISTPELHAVRDAGFMAVVRVQNYTPVNTEAMENGFKRIAASGAKVTAYLPAGREVMGYPDGEYDMARLLHDYDIRLGLIEHTTQLQFAPFAGYNDLLENCNYDAVRVYTIDEAEMNKLTLAAAMRRWSISDAERNIRMNYVKPFQKPQDGMGVLELNLQYVRGITASVQNAGFEIGQATQLEAAGTEASGNSFAGSYFPPRGAMGVLGFGIFAGLAIYLGLLLDLEKKWQLFIALGGGLTAACFIFFFRGLLTRQVLALIAAVIFPVLAMNAIVDIWESDRRRSVELTATQIILAAFWQLALAIVLSLVGATFIASVLGDIRFFLEADIYRGVKLTFVLPPLLMGLLFVKRFNVFGEALAGKEKKSAFNDGFEAQEEALPLGKQITKLAKMKISVGALLCLGALAVVAYIFIGRSGHTAGVPVPGIEVRLRIFLEQVMYARPREKEFLVGHPAFFVAAYAAYNRAPRLWQLLLCMAAVVGQASLVQTFCHMRTPVLMSYIRALDGYALGAALGVVAVVLLATLLPYMQEWKRRYLTNE